MDVYRLIALTVLGQLFSQHDRLHGLTARTGGVSTAWAAAVQWAYRSMEKPKNIVPAAELARATENRIHALMWVRRRNVRAQSGRSRTNSLSLHSFNPLVVTSARRIRPHRRSWRRRRRSCSRRRREPNTLVTAQDLLGLSAKLKRATRPRPLRITIRRSRASTSFSFGRHELSCACSSDQGVEILSALLRRGELGTERGEQATCQPGFLTRLVPYNQGHARVLPSKV